MTTTPVHLATKVGRAFIRVSEIMRHNNSSFEITRSGKLFKAGLDFFSAEAATPVTAMLAVLKEFEDATKE
jgi:hypothetical protein